MPVRSRMSFGIRIKFHLGRTKGRDKRGMGEKPKIRVIFAKFPLLSKTQPLSHKLLVRLISNHHHCNLHAQKPICNDFQVISSSFSWSKTTLCILRNKCGFQIGNAMENINSVLIPSINTEKLSLHLSLSTPYAGD